MNVEILNDLHHGRIPPSPATADAGANMGNHTIFFSKMCRAENLCSFESQKAAGVIFKRNMLLNQIQKVIFFNRKIDAEGDERNVLKGEYQTLNTHSPDILIEIRPRNIKSVHDFPPSSGYHFPKQSPGENCLCTKKNKARKQSPSLFPARSIPW